MYELRRIDAMRALDALVDDFAEGDIVTVRARDEKWRVLDKHDPRGQTPKAGFYTICCVPLVLCVAVSPGALTDDPLWIEPRDLHHAEMVVAA